MQMVLSLEYHKHVFISFIEVKTSQEDTSSLILGYIFPILTELIDPNIRIQSTAGLNLVEGF